jgi:hypothetical protein
MEHRREKTNGKAIIVKENDLNKIEDSCLLNRNLLK